uniref:EF-hand domain-containing protein n=1 Tax=Phaeomonas parva TaxID=124430 RepID=A0A7S1XUC6_9STRA
MDEVQLLSRRFRGDMKNRVRYRGKLLQLLDVSDFRGLERRFLRLLAAAEEKSGASLESMFGVFDESGDGQLGREELGRALRKYVPGLHGESGGGEEHRREAFVTYLLREMDGDGDAAVSIREFVRYVRSKQERSGPRLAAKLAKVLNKAELLGQNLTDVFSLLDEDGSGDVEFGEFAKGLTSMGIVRMGFSEADMRAVFDMVDNDRSGSIDIAEFFQQILNREYTPQYELEARLKRFFAKLDDQGVSGEAIFQLLDRNRNGKVTIQELNAGLREMGILEELSIAPEEIQDLLNRAFDDSGRGFVTLVDFLSFMDKSPADGAGFDTQSGYRPRHGLERELMALVGPAGPGVRSVLEDMRASYAEVNDLLPAQLAAADAAGTGKLSAEALRGVLVKQGLELDEDEEEALFGCFREDRKAQVSVEDFLAAGREGDAPEAYGELDGGLKAKVDALFMRNAELEAGMNLVAREDFVEALRAVGVRNPAGDDVDEVCGRCGDSEGDGEVNFARFGKYLRNLKQVVEDEAAQRGSARVVGEAEETLYHILKNSGADIEAAFKVFDTEGKGRTTTDEFVEGLKRIGSEKLVQLSKAKIDELLMRLDEDGSGFIEEAEFKEWYRQGGHGHGAAEAGARHMSMDARKALTKLHDALALVEKAGTAVDTCFRGLCHNKKSMTKELLLSGLEEIGISHIDSRDADEIVAYMDEDGDGTVDVDEFLDWYYKRGAHAPNKPAKPAAAGAGAGQKRPRPKPKAQAKETALAIDVSDLRGLSSDTDRMLARKLQDLFGAFDRAGKESLEELFAALLERPQSDFEYESEGKNGAESKGESPSRRAAASNAGGRVATDELLRKLEDINDAELLRESLDFRDADLKRRLRGVLKNFEFDGDGRVSLPRFLRFLRGEDFGAPSRAAGDEEAKDAATGLGAEDGMSGAYEFSADIDVRAAEKKLRRLVRLEQRSGRLAPAHVQAIFEGFDNRSTGTVVRSDFLLCLMELGLSLYDGDNSAGALTVAPGKSDRKRQRQLAQLQRSRLGHGAKSTRERAAAARRLLRHPEGSVEHKMLSGGLGDEMEALSLLRWYREGRKKQVVRGLLTRSLTRDVHVFPRLGQTEWFEFTLHNPFDHEENFRIELDDADVRVVTRADEWAYLRKHVNPCAGAADPAGNAAVEHDMVYVDPDAPEHERHAISLLPREKVRVPFSVLHLDAKGRREEKVVPIAFRSHAHGHVVALLNVHVHPRRQVVHRSFTFSGGEGEVLRRCIQLVYDGASPGIGIPSDPDGELLGDGAVARYDAFGMKAPRSALFLHTIDLSGNNRVVVEWREGVSGAGANPEVWLKYRVPPFPGTGEFYVLVYRDPYQAQLRELWHVHVNARLRLDLHATAGQAVTADLVVRGDSFTRRVRAYSSLPKEVSFDQAGEFALVAGSYNRIGLRYRPTGLSSVTKRISVHLIDADTQQLVCGWIATATTAAPVVTRTFDVDVTVDDEASKRIPYSNPWSRRRAFKLISSNPGLVRPRSARLEVEARASGYIRLALNGDAIDAGAVEEVLLFVNDDEDNTEECFLLRLRGV